MKTEIDPVDTGARAQGTAQGTRDTGAALSHACSDFDAPIPYRVHSSAWPIPYRLTEQGAHYDDLPQRAREAGL